MLRLYHGLVLLLLLVSILKIDSAFSQCNFTNLNSAYRVDDPAFTLTGGTFYYGDGVNINSFNPAIAGVGKHTIITGTGSATTYVLQTTGSFNPIAGSGTSLTLSDDSQSGLIGLNSGAGTPFNFNFFGNNYSSVVIGSNGIIGFSTTNMNSPIVQSFPDNTTPNNIIAAVWDDFDPALGGTIEYFTVGNTPTRTFVVNYKNLVQKTFLTTVNVQVQLHESSNIIEIHSTNVNSSMSPSTQGIESEAGAMVWYTALDRNNSKWAATNDLVSIVPNCIEVKTVTVYAVPNVSLPVSPSTTTICSGVSVPVTIGSSESGIEYQLRNNADDTPLSGFVSGTGGNLTINSNAISTNLTIKVYVRNITTLYDNTLTNKTNVTIATLPSITTQPIGTTVCEGTAVGFTVTTNGTGITYQWKKNGITLSGEVSSNYSIPSPNTANAGTYTVVVSGACGAPVTSSGAILNINKAPEITVDLASNETKCQAENITFIVNAGATTSPVYQWRKDGNNISGETSAGYTISNIAAAHAGNYDVVISSGVACGLPKTSIVSALSVSPLPLISASPQSICDGQTTNIAIGNPNSISGTVFSWTVQSSNNVTNATAGGGIGVTSISQALALINPVIAGTVTYQIVGTAAGCNGPPFAATVTVLPIPTASAYNVVICSGQSTSISLANPNLVSGTTFNWTTSVTNVSGASSGAGSVINQVLNASPITTSNGTTDYQITPVANGCSGTPILITATVKPITIITTSSTALSPQICSGSTLNFTPTSSVAGTTYSWTSSIAGTINVASVTATGSGAITDTPINTGNSSGTVTYQITPQVNGCDGLPVSYVVTIKPLPTASTSDVVVCSGQNATINISSLPLSVSGTTFAWTASTNGSLTGYSDGNGSQISQTLTNTNTLARWVDYTITPTAGGCNGAQFIVRASVDPIVSVNAGLDYSVCEKVGMPTTIDVSGTIGGGAASGTWSIVSGTGTITSSTTVGSSVTATYTIGASDVASSVTFLLTSNDPTGPCSFMSDDLKININRAPRASAPADYFVCESAKIYLTGTLSGGAYTGTWTKVTTAGGSLSASSLTGSTVTATYDTLKADVGSVLTFRLTTNDADGSGPCLAAADTIQITINESARTKAGLDTEVCEDKVVQLNGSYSGSTSTVTWSGGSGGSRFENVNNPISKYNLTAADKAAGVIKLVLSTNDPDGSASSGPCAIVRDTVAIKINKFPRPRIYGLDAVYPENHAVVNLIGIEEGGTFTGPGIVSGTNKFDPSQSGTGSLTITYTFTDLKGCVGDTTATTIVNPVTTVDFDVADASGTTMFGRDANGFPMVCANQGNVVLIGSPSNNDANHKSPTHFEAISPALIPRLNAINLSPTVKIWRINTDGLPGGRYTLRYIYTNQFNATDTLTKDIVVQSAPVSVITLGDNCIDNVIKFTEASYMADNGSGGVIKMWAWLYGEGSNGSVGTTREPSYLYSNPGTHLVYLLVTTDQGCQNTTSKSIVIGIPPTPDFAWSSYCQGDTTVFVNNSSSSFGAINGYAWDFDDGDTLGLASSTKSVPAGKHSGRTFGIWETPQHIYADFKTYNVKLTVSTNAKCSATTIRQVNVLQSSMPSSTDAYNINFENGSGTWVAVSAASNTDLVSWKFGTPSGSVINRASSGINAWWTGTNTNSLDDKSTYYKNEKSYVIGPCLNIESLKRPMISFDYWAHTQVGFDGAVVQYSLDGGASWIPIGDAEGGGINWYNSRTLSSYPGGQNHFAWSQMNEGWVNARYNLDGIPHDNRGKVVFRIAFASNSDNPSGSVLEGFAFDNIYIGEKKRNVLVEHFTNINPQYTSVASNLDNLYDSQTDPFASTYKEAPDFTKIQYHLASPSSDIINKDNPRDPATRALYYGVAQPPYTIMDGILGDYYNTEFNGDHGLIQPVILDKRALEDPLFNIEIDTILSNQNILKANVKFNYIDSLSVLNTNISVQIALIESNVGGHRNVVRKLLPPSGTFFPGPWSNDLATKIIPIDYTIDVPIENSDNLYILAFVQNKDGSTDRRIHQSLMVKAPRKVGRQVVGLPEELPGHNSTAEIQDIRVYPNPAKNVINFELDNGLAYDYTWELVDQRGAVILSGGLNRNLTTAQQVNIDSIASGVYYVLFKAKNGMKVYRKVAVFQ